MKAKLTRLTDNGHTRTKEMIGECREPEVGKPFVIVNDDPLVKENGENMRLIETSPIQYMCTLFDKQGWSFSTLNTSYMLEVME